MQNAALKFDKFDLSVLILKSLKTERRSTILWGPETRLVESALTKAWNKHGQKHIEAIKNAFTVKGRKDPEISVNVKKVEAAQKKLKDAGKKTWADANEKVLQALAATEARATKHFMQQAKDALAKQDLEQLLIAEANADHVAIFTERFPGRVVQPEVRRMVGLAKQSPGLRTVDKITLVERIRRFDKLPTRYWEGLSEVHVGRAWNYTGLQMAQSRGVSEGVIIAQRDERTCPVCGRMDGKTFSVPDAASRAVSIMESTTPDQIVSQGAFPRVADIDNRSPAQIRSAGYMPPFHNRCRCEIQMLWSQSPAAPEIAAPPMFKDEKLQAQYEKSFTKFSKMPLKDFTDKKVWMKSLSPSVRKGLDEWTGDTTKPYAMALKRTYVRLENPQLKVRMPSWWSKKKLDGIKAAQDKIKDVDYVNMRAWSQAYMEKKGIKEVKLHRGIQGETGRMMTRELDTSAAEVVLKEDPIIGFSTNPDVANTWGMQAGGVNTWQTLGRRDIIMYEECWFKTAAKKGDMIAWETETIAIGGNRTVNMQAQVWGEGSDGIYW